MMLVEYLERLLPHVAECFFSVTKTKQRRFQWPGLRTAVSCLLLEAMCLVLAPVLLTFMSLGWGSLLVTGLISDTATPALPPASGRKKGETFPLVSLDFSKKELLPGYPEIIQDFIARSEPVIVKNLPKATFSALAPGAKYAPQVDGGILKKGTTITEIFHDLSALGKIGQWIQKHVQKPLIYMLRMHGKYESGPAHMDGFTFNIYYVARGRKRVWICPRQYNHLLKFQSGTHFVFIPGSEPGSPNPQKWTQSVPGVWMSDLEEGDLLLWNNSACVHQFENLTENPEIFSMRTFNRDMSPVIAKFFILNWRESMKFARDILAGAKTLESDDGVTVKKTR